MLLAEVIHELLQGHLGAVCLPPRHVKPVPQGPLNVVVLDWGESGGGGVWECSLSLSLSIFMNYYYSKSLELTGKILSLSLSTFKKY